MKNSEEHQIISVSKQKGSSLKVARPLSSDVKRNFPPSIPKNESTKLPGAEEEPQKPPAIKAAKTAAQFEAALQDKIIMNVREVHYDIIKNIAKKTFGWRCTRLKPDKATGSTALTHKEADWDLIWIDADFKIDRLQGMKPYQKINHFPGMTIISLKNNLAKYLKLAQKEMASEFTFFPKTWIFPSESYDLMNFMQEKKKPMTLIVKPTNSSQGKGIFLTRKMKDIPRDTCHVVQQYKSFPYLLEGKKFDLRLYCLVTQVCPDLQAFLYHDGLGRFATENYSGSTNNENLCMHLTNYAINKESEKFQENESEFKKSLKETLALIQEQEGEEAVIKLQQEMKDIIIKTLLIGLPHLEHNYKTCSSKSSYQNNRQCFQILGFDIMLDKKLKPWLLEVNESPSFNDDTDVDKVVKGGLIEDTLRLLDIKKHQKQKIKELAQNKSVFQRNKLNQMTEEQIQEKQVKDEQQMLLQQRNHETFQNKNLGGFERIFPIKIKTKQGWAEDENPEQAELLAKKELYDNIKEVSKGLFNNQFGGKKKQPSLLEQKIEVFNPSQQGPNENVLMNNIVQNGQTSQLQISQYLVNITNDLGVKKGETPSKPITYLQQDNYDSHSQQITKENQVKFIRDSITLQSSVSNGKMTTANEYLPSINSYNSSKNKLPIGSKTHIPTKAKIAIRNSMIASPKNELEAGDAMHHSNMKGSNSGQIATSAVKKGKAEGMQAYEMFNPLEMESGSGARLDYLNGQGYLSKVLEQPRQQLYTNNSVNYTKRTQSERRQEQIRGPSGLQQQPNGLGLNNSRCDSGRQIKRGPRPAGMAAAQPKPQQIGFSGDLGGFGLNGMGMSINNKLKQTQQQKQLPPIAPAQQRQSTIGTNHSQNLAPGIAQKPIFLDSQTNYNFAKPSQQSIQPNNGQGLYFNDKDGDFATKIKMKSQALQQKRQSQTASGKSGRN